MPSSGPICAHTLWNVRRISFNGQVGVVSQGHRSERLNELFRRELTNLLLGSLKDPRLVGASIAAVRATTDLSAATVYVRSVGNIEGAIEGLEHASGFIRRELGQSLRLRKIPQFRFVVDDTLEYASRIEELLRETQESDVRGAD